MGQARRGGRVCLQTWQCRREAGLSVHGKGPKGSSTKASTSKPSRSSVSWQAEQKPRPVARSPRTPNRQAPAPAVPQNSRTASSNHPQLSLIREPARALEFPPVAGGRAAHRAIPSSEDKPSQTWSVPRLRTHPQPSGRDSRNVRSGRRRERGSEAPSVRPGSELGSELLARHFHRLPEASEGFPLWHLLSHPFTFQGSSYPSRR